MPDSLKRFDTLCYVGDIIGYVFHAPSGIIDSYDFFCALYYLFESLSGFSYLFICFTYFCTSVTSMLPASDMFDNDCVRADLVGERPPKRTGLLSNCDGSSTCIFGFAEDRTLPTG